MGSAKPCFHPVLPGKCFPTGKAATLGNLRVISTQLVIFLKLVLLTVGEKRREDGQVLPRWTFLQPSLGTYDDFLNIGLNSLLTPVQLYPC